MRWVATPPTEISEKPIMNPLRVNTTKRILDVNFDIFATVGWKKISGMAETSRHGPFNLHNIVRIGQIDGGGVASEIQGLVSHGDHERSDFWVIDMGDIGHVFGDQANVIAAKYSLLVVGFQP